MTTELMLLGMKCQTKFNEWLGPFPVTWDEKDNQYIFKRHPKDLKFYYFTLLCLMSLNLQSVLWILYQRYYHPVDDFTIAHYVVYVLFALLVGFLEGVAFGIFISGHEMVLSLNTQISLLWYLRGGQQQNLKKEKKGKQQLGLKGWIEKAKALSKEEDGSRDLMGGFMMYFASFSLWFHIFTPILGVVLNMSPINWVAYDLLGANYIRQLKVAIVLFFLTVPFFVINTAQGVRLIQVIVIMAIIPLQFSFKTIIEINKLFRAAQSTREFEKVHLEYVKSKLINMYLMPVIQSQVYLLMTSGKFMCVGCLFICLKMNQYIDPLITAGMAVAAIAIMSILRLSLPNVSKANEMTVESLTNWNNKMESRSQYLRRKFRALVPHQFYGGLPGVRFFTFDKSIIAEYFQSMVDIMIDLMIGYPDKDIKALFKK